MLPSRLKDIRIGLPFAISSSIKTETFASNIFCGEFCSALVFFQTVDSKQFEFSFSVSINSQFVCNLLVRSGGIGWDLVGSSVVLSFSAASTIQLSRAMTFSLCARKLIHFDCCLRLPHVTENSTQSRTVVKGPYREDFL